MGDTERALGASPPPLLKPLRPPSIVVTGGGGGLSFRRVCGRLPSTQPFVHVKVNCATTHARSDVRAESGTRRDAAFTERLSPSSLIGPARSTSFPPSPSLPAVTHAL